MDGDMVFYVAKCPYASPSPRLKARELKGESSRQEISKLKAHQSERAEGVRSQKDKGRAGSIPALCFLLQPLVF